MATTASLIIKINGKEIENTFSAIKKEVKTLQRDLNKLTPGTKEFTDKAQELKNVQEHFRRVKDEINEVNGRLQKSEGFIGKFVKSFGGIGNVFSVLGGVSLAATAQELLKISDAITDVQKTSGLAQKEVEELWKEFSNFDTRTSKLELMNIAQIGGRLGITDKEQLQEFTREIDKIYVALGDSFQGGLEEVTTKVGKLKNLFNETKDSDYPKALNEIGSALNELGANGTASESNITDFATRIGQLPNSLKPAIDSTLGLGAAFEESGVDAEIAASGYSRFVSVAGNNLDGFARQMKITKEEASQLFNTKPEEFFLKFAESMKGLSGEQSANILKGLKLNTLEVQKALGAAGDNAGRFRDLMALSSQAMSDATSIQEEFNKKNENAAAIWEKIGRGLKDFVTDGVIPDFFNWLSNILGQITGVTDKAGDGMKIFRERIFFLIKTLAVVTAAIVSYKTAVYLATLTTKKAWEQTILANAALKVKNALVLAGRTIVLVAKVAWALFTFNIQGARNAMIAFNAATAANPIGAILAVIAAAVVAFQLFNKTIDENIRQQKRLNDIKKEVSDAAERESREVKLLIKIINDETKSRNERELAMRKLQEIAPEYFKTLDIDKLKTDEGRKAIEMYTKSLLRKKEIETLTSKVNENTDKLREVESQGPLEHNSNWNPLNWFRNKEDYENTFEEEVAQEKEYLQKLVKEGKLSAKGYQSVLKSRMEILGSIYENQNQIRRELKADLERDKKRIEELVNQDFEEEAKKNKLLPTNNDDDDPEKPPKPSKKDYSSEYERAKKARLQAEQELQKEITQNLEESLDKQLAITEQKYNDKKFKLQQENTDLELKNNELSKANDPQARKAIEENRKIIEINHQIELELEKQKQAELTQVREKHHVAQVERTLKEYNECIDIKKRQKAEEILLITDLDSAKQALQGKISERELAQIKTLEDAKKALHRESEKEILQVSLESFEAQKQIVMDYIRSISDGEAKQKLLDDLKKLEEAITQIKQKQGEGDGEDTPKAGSEAEKIDVLGFSAKEWEDTFNNLDQASARIRAIEMGVGALNNAFSMFSQLQQNLNEKEMRSFSASQEKRKKQLLAELNQGYISKAQYNKELQRLDEESEAKKKELSIKQFKAQKAMNLMNITANTATGIMRAYSDTGPIAGNVFAAIVAALGAVQFGIVAAQQPPSYARGGRTRGLGFTDESGHEVAGIVHANEYVIPQWLRKDPEVARVEQWLEAKRQSGSAVNLYAEGGRTTASSESQNVVSASESQWEQNQQVSSAIYRLVELLEKIDKDGIDAFVVADAKNGREMQKAIKLYQELKDRNKH